MYPANMDEFIRMAIISRPEAEAPQPAEIEAWAKAAVARGANTLLLRHSRAAWVEAVLPALQPLRRTGIQVGINTDWKQFMNTIKLYDFIHLKSNYFELYTDEMLFDLIAKLQDEDKYLSAACHTEKEIRLAGHFNLNWVVVSPVFRTATHPKQSPMGLRKLIDYIAVARSLELPVIALGGIKTSDEPALRAAQAAGWAAIGAFA